MMSKGYCSGGNPWYGVVFFLLILAGMAPWTD